MQIFLFLVLGLAAGVTSGLIGIGGGIIVVTALVFLFGFSSTRRFWQSSFHGIRTF